jgi:hypothetical protein
VKRRVERAYDARDDIPSHLKVRHRHALVARQVEHRVEQRGRVPVAEHEAVAAEPLGRLGVEAHDLREEHVRDGRAAHRRARVPRVRVLHNVRAEHADRVDAALREGGRHGSPRGDWPPKND